MMHEGHCCFLLYHCDSFHDIVGAFQSNTNETEILTGLWSIYYSFQILLRFPKGRGMCVCACPCKSNLSWIDVSQQELL